jgi:hypothetical protein
LAAASGSFRQRRLNEKRLIAAMSGKAGVADNLLIPEADIRKIPPKPFESQRKADWSLQFSL